MYVCIGLVRMLAFPSTIGAVCVLVKLLLQTYLNQRAPQQEHFLGCHVVHHMYVVQEASALRPVRGRVGVPRAHPSERPSIQLMFPLGFRAVL